MTLADDMDPPSTDPDEGADARTQRHLRMLRELAEIGLEIARGSR